MNIQTQINRWEVCTHHIKDVGSFTDINGFLELQGEPRIELEEDRRCAYCPGRFSYNCSRGYDVRYGITLFRSAHYPSKARMNIVYHKRAVEIIPEDLHLVYVAMHHFRIDGADICLIAILQGHPCKMSPSCAWTVISVVGVHSKPWLQDHACHLSYHPQILPPR